MKAFLSHRKEDAVSDAETDFSYEELAVPAVIVHQRREVHIWFWMSGTKLVLFYLW